MADKAEELAHRVELLERRLLGKAGQREGQPPLTTSVGYLNDKLAGLGGNSVEAAWKKIPELEKALSPDFASQLGAESKAEVVSAQAERLKPLCEPAEQVHKLKDYLQVTEFQGLVGQERRLGSLARAQSQLEGDVERLSHAVQEVMQTYQQIIMQLSTKYIEWNETLDKLESSH